jgi:hypothetical protein
MINMLDCVLLSSTLCGRVDVYLPLRIQNASFFDLFDMKAIVELQRTHSISIQFYCPTLEKFVLNRIEALDIPKRSDSGNISKLCKKAIQRSVPILIRDLYSADPFTESMLLSDVRILIDNPSVNVQGLIRNALQIIRGKDYVGIHSRFESDSWALTEKPIPISRFYKLTLQILWNILEPVYPVMPWYATSQQKLKAPRDIIVKTSVGVSSPYPTRYRDGRPVSVTNSTGALVDFILMLRSNVTLLARYSSFGSILRALRCTYGIGHRTFTYGTRLGVQDGCSSRPHRFSLGHYEGEDFTLHEKLQNYVEWFGRQSVQVKFTYHVLANISWSVGLKSQAKVYDELSGMNVTRSRHNYLNALRHAQGMHQGVLCILIANSYGLLGDWPKMLLYFRRTLFVLSQNNFKPHERSSLKKQMMDSVPRWDRRNNYKNVWARY